jgi:tripartite-type tricarboxylate transporter receptor subunit TctC
MSRLTRYGLCVAIACISPPHAAFSQTYPSKPVRVVVAYPPGGAADLLARVLQPHMRDALGQQLVVENRAGAGGQIGAQHVASSAPDGYTIMTTVGPAHLLARFTAKKLAYDPVKDFTPITSGIASVLCIAANPAFPPNTVTELVTYAKRNPGKVSFGTTAIGGESHLSMELIKSITGASMTHVPYKGGGPATSDLVGNHIPLLVLPVSTVMEHVHKGRAKVIGILSQKRFPGLPQVGTVSEALPAFSSSGSWIAVYGPAGIPQPIVLRLHGAISRVLNSAEVRERLEASGQFVVANTPQQFAEQIERAMELYAKLVKLAGIQPE